MPFRDRPLLHVRPDSPLRHASRGPTRVELGTRTIFNLLGPLSNPAGVTRQLLGVFAAWLVPLTQVLKDLGSESVWVVHGPTVSTRSPRPA